MPNQAGIDDHSNQAEALASGYATTNRRKVHTQLFSDLEAAARDGTSLSILDIGAGSGDDAFEMAKLGHQVCAVEPSALLDIAKRDHAHPAITYINDALPNLDRLPEQQFDVVLMSAVLQYIDPAERVDSLERVGHLLKPGGKLVVMYPSPPSRDHQFEITQETFMQELQQANSRLPSHKQLTLAGEAEISLDTRGRKGLNGQDLQFYNYELASAGQAKRVQQSRATSQSAQR